MRARSLGAVVAVAVTCAAARAHADDRLVLVDPPAPLARAAHEQLAPYHIDVVIAPAVGGDARLLADRYQARAVAWLEGDTLLVFDAGDGALARRAAPTPLDAAGAAALALTLKTVLRTRWDAEDAAAAAAADTSKLDVAIATGLRVHGTAAEPRITLAVDARAGAIQLGLRGSLGNGVPVHAEGFSGTWNDRALGAVALVPWSAGDLAFRAGAGASVHWTDIHGVLLPAGDAGQASTINVGLDGEAMALWQHAPIAVGLRAAATWVPWRQRYTVTDLAVFEVSHVESEIGLVVIFAF